VVAGDTLWTIARTNHLSVAQLESMNHLTDASVLQIGQSIVFGTTPAAKVARSARRAHVAKSAAAKTVVHHAISTGRAPAAAIRRPATPEPGAAKNAVWVATHTGQAPAPPASMSFEIARRILAFDERVTHTALRYIGVPYVWGGTSFGGVDCSGFVYAVFEHNGIYLPRTADSQFEVGRPVATRDLQPGDLVFFQTYAPGASHVGIYLGGGRFVHASASDGVRIDELSMDYYAERYIGARRLIH
jgi:cell wall-associated NlpC family hydrolase